MDAASTQSVEPIGSSLEDVESRLEAAPFPAVDAVEESTMDGKPMPISTGRFELPTELFRELMGKAQSFGMGNA